MNQKLHDFYVWLGKALYYLLSPLRWIILSHSVRAYALIEHDSRILLVRNWISSGEWSLPGGGVHSWERAAAGVRRELREELGVTIVPDQAELIKEGFKKDTFGGKHYLLYNVNLPYEPQLHVRKIEITKAQWVPLTSVAELSDISEEVTAALSARVTKQA